MVYRRQLKVLHINLLIFNILTWINKHHVLPSKNDRKDRKHHSESIIMYPTRPALQYIWHTLWHSLMVFTCSSNNQADGILWRTKQYKDYHKNRESHKTFYWSQIPDHFSVQDQKSNSTHSQDEYMVRKKTKKIRECLITKPLLSRWLIWKHEKSQGLVLIWCCSSLCTGNIPHGYFDPEWGKENLGDSTDITHGFTFKIYSSN